MTYELYQAEAPSPTNPGCLTTTLSLFKLIRDEQYDVDASPPRWHRSRLTVVHYPIATRIGDGPWKPEQQNSPAEFALELDHARREGYFRGDLLIRPEMFRGHGVGSRILDHLIAFGHDMGGPYRCPCALFLSEVDSEGDPENQVRRHALYERPGFGINYRSGREQDGIFLRSEASIERLDQLKRRPLGTSRTTKAEILDLPVFLRGHLSVSR